MSTYKQFKPKKYDDYFTRKIELKQLAPFIPKNAIVSMPFYSPYCKCNRILSKYIDNKIIYKNEDFFDNDRGTMVFDTPPTRKKKKIILELIKRNKPFMLIVPVSTLAYNYSKPLKNYLQLLFFKSRPSFIQCDPDTGKIKDKNYRRPYDSVVMCWRMNFKKDINYIE
jgi:hypothetical protein|tara:strand:+ start:8326 stop:8829 length:504 start_codon:yes stop_codon:yes gene_type:complete